MEPRVQAALISGSAALAVAVVGVIATGVWQTVATRRAHRNALHLFAEQTQEQERVRQEQA